jgi:homoserine trans-succinylase
MATMERKLDMLVKVMTTYNISPIQQIAQVEVCAICSHSYYTTETCHMSSFTNQDKLNYVGQNNYPPKNNPYSNTYNAGWRNHPNFLWSNNQNVQNPQGQQRNFQKGNNYQAPPQVVQPNPEPKKNDLEDALLEFFTKLQ